jgi:pyruvate/2-oxoglutarate dehydrogenase complex dihydrolipoamide dehydrogenase (E3) component
MKGCPALTQISYDDFRILKNNILTNAPTKTTTNRLIPYTVFIDPQLGRIGLTETEAKQQDKKVRVSKMPMAWVARALEMDASRGFMKVSGNVTSNMPQPNVSGAAVQKSFGLFSPFLKVLVDAKSDQFVGAAILGIDGGEVMSMLQIATIENYRIRI